MFYNQEIDFYYEPKDILQNLSSVSGSQMTDFDLGFLCGIIKKYSPKKILEIGVFAGGTTSVMMQCIKNLNLETELYSVDIAEYCYGNNKVGFLAEECKEILRFDKWELYRGGILPAFGNYIGNGIDMLVLDTAHILPGEVLDFITALPLLTKNAIVILHDIVISHWGVEECIASKVLLDTITADKIICANRENTAGYPNICAFMINDDTIKNIDNVFSALTINWEYVPDSRQVDLFRNHIKKYYDRKYVDIFNTAVSLNRFSLERKEKNQKEDLKSFIDFIRDMYQRENIWLYGSGKVGQRLYKVLQICGINIKGFLVSDDQEVRYDLSVPVQHLSDVKELMEQYNIIIAVDSKSKDFINKILIENGYNKAILLNEQILRFLRKIYSF